MFPDYPKVKSRLREVLAQFVKAEIRRRSPILDEISRIRQHEGRTWSHRMDGGSDAGKGYERFAYESSVTRDEMIAGDVALLFKKGEDTAEYFAETQTRALFDAVSTAAKDSGNIVEGHGEFDQESFLALLDRFETRFDPETRQPTGGMFVMHPDLAAKVVPKLRDWEKDRDFVARVAEIHDKQWIAWRDREARRTLAD